MVSIDQEHKVASMRRLREIASENGICSDFDNEVSEDQVTNIIGGGVGFGNVAAFVE